MNITREFTVPSYYRKFCCKGGSCRHTCCEGLEVNITEEEYYRLLTLECSPELRRRLDSGVRLNGYADRFRYAQITPDFRGSCHMLNEDGLCQLQKECGFKVLSSVCRYYPRSPRIEDAPECAMADSCEETLELLLQQAREGRPWAFETRELSFDLPGERTEGGPLAAEKTSITRRMARILADSSRDPGLRFAMLRRCAEESSGTETDQELEERALQDLAIQQPEALSLFTGDSIAAAAEWCAEQYPEMSVSMHRAAEKLRAREGCTEPLHREVMAARWKLESLIPDFDAFTTLVLVNDLFYRHVPYERGGLSVSRQTQSFCLTADLLLLAAAEADGITDGREQEKSDAALVDCYAAFFRMVDLTDFARQVLAAAENSNDEGGNAV